ncbi:hypothetical protein KPATCC21470_0674 [Kitasatospora purpeofusca]
MPGLAPGPHDVVGPNLSGGSSGPGRPVRPGRSRSTRVRPPGPCPRRSPSSAGVSPCPRP